MVAYDDEQIVRIPLAAESATVAKRTVQTGRVRVRTRVEDREELVRAALQHDDVSIERVPIGQVVATAPVVRMEGDILIYPVVEETLVVETRLVLKEELRITRRSHVQEVERRITLRTEHADIERLPVEPFDPQSDTDIQER